MTTVRPHAVTDYLMEAQDHLCRALAEEDGGAGFHEDTWERSEGGGGRSRVLTAGTVFEQAGVNFSHVMGDRLPATATDRRPELAGRRFEATGISVVAHPWNPYVPTAHANVRFFVAEKPGTEPVWWFGGGYDLTPSYPFDEDAVHWHRVARAAVAPYGDDLYARFKRWCDEYFYLPHRDEMRGVGGLFFDDFDEGGFENAYALMRSVASSFTDAYLPIVQRRRDRAYGDRERRFQLYRRGRYVEFNLLFDRGTRFGIQSGGHTEAILMSLPPLARWEYGYRPPEDSEEAALDPYLAPRDWLELDNDGPVSSPAE